MTTFKQFAAQSEIELVATYEGVHADKRTTHSLNTCTPLTTGLMPRANSKS